MRPSAVAVALALALALALAGCARAQCDLQQEVAVGSYYDIASPNYDASYAPGTHCRWRASAAAASAAAGAAARLKLSCGVFQLPSSTGCQGDRVRVSLSGDDGLGDAHTYCGQGAFTLVSDADKLTMVLETSYSSRGGRFLCNITAILTSTCMCGMKKQSRIVGGQETGVNEFPFMAGLVDTDLRQVYCGATILSNHWALTAAHCTDNRDVSKIGLLVGEHDTTTGGETAATALYRVLYFRVHPQYGQPGAVDRDNDVALARAHAQIVMSREVMPACLPFRYSNWDFTGSKVEVTGWGTDEFGGRLSPVLMKADLYIQSPAQCAAVYGASVSYRQMCSYNAGKDACQSDSGGPLFWQDPYSGRTHVVGVVSHGVGCANDHPGVNTRVTAHLHWIAGVIAADDTYCIV